MGDVLCVPCLSGDFLIIIPGLADRGLHAGGRGGEDSIVGGCVGGGVVPGGFDGMQGRRKGSGLGAVDFGCR